jgi:hypothetical protein
MKAVAISGTVIEEATKKLVASPAFAEKLSWWLRSPHAAERWFQFEWAFCLQQTLGDGLAVLCELKWNDIACITLPAQRPKLWENPAATILELNRPGFPGGSIP